MGHLLISLFEEKQSFALYLLQKQGLKKFDLVQFISHGQNQGQSQRIEIEIHTPGQNPGPAGASPNAPTKTKSAIESFTLNYTKKAKDSGFDPLIGREKELARCLQVLSRRNKNNPILVGEPGVGKTAIAQGLAQMIIQGDVPDLSLIHI